MGAVEITERSVIAPLFEGWQETMIWSCLQGVMGRAYADENETPRSARIAVADFCFFAGVPNRELIKNKPPGRKPDFIIMVPRDEEWARAIEEEWGSSAKRVTRYAMKKEPDAFDPERLEEMAGSTSFSLSMIDKEIYEQVMAQPWSRDLCSQFAGYDDYKRRGLGVAALADGLVVSGASSYTVYQGGIEIEIDTRADYRRRGAALACGARLILECLKRGLYPSWDAQNPGSVALAEKLGYHMDQEYTAYEIKGC
ncbi:GNAT family N-acetyltransferase [Lachnospiraceae bacterium 54-53]